MYTCSSYSFEKRQAVGAKRSEIALIDALEQVCDITLQYNLHKDRIQGTRFDKKKTSFFQSMDELVGRGVKVDIGIPHELWGSPTAESRLLQLRCEQILEKYEKPITQWYFNEYGKTSLEDYLCKNLMLKEADQTCFLDVIEKQTETPEETEKADEEEEEELEVEEVEEEEEREVEEVEEIEETTVVEEITATEKATVTEEAIVSGEAAVTEEATITEEITETDEKVAEEATFDAFQALEEALRMNETIDGDLDFDEEDEEEDGEVEDEDDFFEFDKDEL